LGNVPGWERARHSGGKGVDACGHLRKLLRRQLSVNGGGGEHVDVEGARLLGVEGCEGVGCPKRVKGCEGVGCPKQGAPRFLHNERGREARGQGTYPPRRYARL
jgi:hypothetical protein